MKKPRKKHIVLLALAAAALALVVWTAWGNTALLLTYITVNSADLPTGFDGYRIAQISDLHNAEFGEANEALLQLLKDAQPDSIVITGDMLDSRHTDVQAALRFAQGAVQIAPCYYVTGNHESRIAQFPAFAAALAELGVTVLRDQAVPLTCNGDTVTLLGVDDPAFSLGEGAQLNTAALMEGKLATLGEGAQGYTILLSHRPELFQTYCAADVDLTFSGHAHGGQVRLPLIGAVYAPNQGLFPQYVDGLYTQGASAMVVSRGLGNSLFPFRFNNRPQVVLAELCQE